MKPPLIRNLDGDPAVVVVHVFDPGDINLENASQHLAEIDRIRASRFHFQKDRDHWVKCRAALRIILGRYLEMKPAEVVFLLTPDGKPVLCPPHDGLHFNLSHCEDLAVIAVSIAGHVGIDLEPAVKGVALLGCEATFCHPAEIGLLPADPASRAAALLKIWTTKEALLKGLGPGLLYPPETVRMEPTGSGWRGISDTICPGIEDLRVWPLEHQALASHVAFLAISGPPSPSIQFAKPERLF